MRHSSAVVENLRFRLDERAACRGGSTSPNVLIYPGPPGHGGRPLGGLSCFWALVFLVIERCPRLRERPFHPTPKQGRWSIRLTPESSRFQRRLASRLGSEVRDDGRARRKLWRR